MASFLYIQQKSDSVLKCCDFFRQDNRFPDKRKLPKSSDAFTIREEGRAQNQRKSVFTSVAVKQGT